MKNLMEYKGYLGSVSFSEEDEILYGKVEFIRDLVSYEGENTKEIKVAFQEAVDDYLQTCEEENREPDKPFKGSFNVRTGSELHRQAAIFAKEQGQNLNQVIIKALEDYLERNTRA